MDQKKKEGLAVDYGNVVNANEKNTHGCESCSSEVVCSFCIQIFFFSISLKYFPLDDDDELDQIFLYFSKKQGFFFFNFSWGQPLA